MMQQTTFGGGPTFTTDVGFSFDLSLDKKAFTAAFSGLEVAIADTASSPIVTKAFSFTVPLSGAEPGEEITLFVSGFALCEAESSAHLVFMVNDQTTNADFSAGTNSDFVHENKHTVTDATELRITVFLVAERNSQADSGVRIHVNAIDTDVLKQER